MPSFCSTTPAIHVFGALVESAAMTRGNKPASGVGARLRELRKTLNVTQAELAERIGVEPPTITRYEGGRDFTLSTLFEIAKALGVDPVDIIRDVGDNPDIIALPAMVPLVGWIGAGSMYYPDPIAGPWVGFDNVKAPFGIQAEAIAVRIRGDAMEPRYSNGDTVFFVRAAHDIDSILGQDCIVQIRGGSAYFRRVERGDHGIELHAYHRATEPIRGVEIEWAAPVEWVRRRSSS